MGDYLKHEIQFPITARQAQKLVSALIRREEWWKLDKLQPLYRAVGLSNLDVLQLYNQLTRMAQKNPQFLIEKAEDEEDDYQYLDNYPDPEEEGEEKKNAEADPLGVATTQEAPEEREGGEVCAKGTDESCPQSDSPADESAYPNGGGNSGECEHRSQADSQQQAQPQENGPGSKDPQEGQTNLSECGAGISGCGSETGGNPTSEGCGMSENSQNLDQQVESSPSTALGHKESDSSASTAGNGVPNAEQPRDAAWQESGDSQLDSGHQDLNSDPTGEEEGPETGGEDVPEAGNNAGADRPAQQKKWGKSFGSHKSARISDFSKPGHAGVTARLADAGVDQSLLRLCQQRLAALVGGDSDQDPSPRRDWAEFCVRLKTYRNPSPARRMEESRPCIWVLADTSPSCGSFSKTSLAVAKVCSKLGVPGADVVVIAHSNGDIEEVEINGKYQPGKQRESNEQRYALLTVKYPPQVVIAIGDWDAVYIYHWLLSLVCVERLIWLDHAHSRNIEKPRNRTQWAAERMGLDSRLRDKLTYTDACREATDFAKNIR